MKTNLTMQALRRSLLFVCAAGAVIACTPSDRQEVRQSANQAAQTTRSEVSKAAAGAERVVDDSAVTAKVKSALLADAQVAGMKIDVDTTSGVVTLRGNAGTISERLRAEQVAQSIDGVRVVRNEIKAP